MAHTLTEQTLSLSANTVDDIHNMFLQQFEYTENGDYYFSPVDTSFGIRWALSSSYIHGYVTFDGGVTEAEFINFRAAVNPPKICYHVSKDEKVIYMRIYYYNYTTTDYLSGVDVVIAHDEKGKTTCFRGHTWAGNANQCYRYVYMFNSEKVMYKIYDSGNFNSASTAAGKNYNMIQSMADAIYRYPSLIGHCTFCELYGVVNIQMFPSLNNTYIQFGNDVYRIVGCFTTISTLEAYGMPYFAFPVSD